MSGVTSKHGLKYAGPSMAALVAIANAAKDRSLEVRAALLCLPVCVCGWVPMHGSVNAWGERESWE